MPGRNPEGKNRKNLAGGWQPNSAASLSALETTARIYSLLKSFKDVSGMLFGFDLFKHLFDLCLFHRSGKLSASRPGTCGP